MTTAKKSFNTDESKVLPYELPELLRLADGSPVTTRQQWTTRRRPEILRLFTQHVYGCLPPANVDHVRYEITEESRIDLPTPAIRRQVTAHFMHQGQQRSIGMLMFVPADLNNPAPVFAGLNFHGNHTVHHDPAIHLPRSWVRNHEQTGATNHHASEQGRGSFADRWDLAGILSNGYALITVYYGDLFPDHVDGFDESILGLFSRTPGERTADSCGAIGAWAWGLSRIIDYIKIQPELDETRVVAFGHSRLGKAALWAGATDPRFTMAISNNSGCGGAAISRRNFGETIQRINTQYPHWFCKAFHNYNDNESQLPVDQHMLLALLAPRPVYVASAQDDLWADPRGEFLSSQHAIPAYHLHGLNEPIHDDMPNIHHPIGHHVGYHLRPGPHGVTKYDWQEYIRFANDHLKTRIQA